MTIKRKKDGSIDGIVSMGDLITNEPLTEKQKEIQKKRAEFKKKYSNKDRGLK